MSQRTFSKSSKLDNVLYDVRGPVVDEAARLESEGAHILKLNIGNPAPFGFRTPVEVIQDMREQLPDCEGYSDSRGLFSARKAIMQYAQVKGLPNVSMDGIYTGNGVSELINLCMQALLDTGDEILIPAPDYPLWTACATLSGGTPVHYRCDEQADWNPDLADMESKITSRTKAIVIINPNNPTGALYPKEVLQQIVDLAREHQLMIFSDEIYDRLVMDGLEHISIASLAPDLFCVTFSGLSKSHMIAGWRVGWMVAPLEVAKAAAKLQGHMTSNVANISQRAALAAVAGPLDEVHEMRKAFDARRRAIVTALNDIEGVNCPTPTGAFYVFADITALLGKPLGPKGTVSDTSADFAAALLDEAHVAAVPGEAFGAPGYLRFSYALADEDLAEGMRRFKEWAN